VVGVDAGAYGDFGVSHITRKTLYLRMAIRNKNEHQTRKQLQRPCVMSYLPLERKAKNDGTRTGRVMGDLMKSSILRVVMRELLSRNLFLQLLSGL
jgi:hypothetical protein